MLKKFLLRPAIDIVIIMFATTTCLAIMFTGLGLTLFILFHPEVQIEQVTTNLQDLLGTLVGALLGLIAGRATTKVTKVPEEFPEGEV